MAKKKFGYLDYTTMGKGKDIMERYGVEGVHYGHPDGRSGKPNRTMEDVSRDIANKAMNDYDTRRTLEAQALAGNKDAKKFSKNGFKGIEDVFKANEMFKELHKDNGNGGKYSSAADRAGVAQGAFEDYEKEQRSYVDEQLDKMRAEMPADADTGAAESAAENMTFNEYLQNKDGGQSAEAGAQKMAGDAIKSIASNPGAMAKGKAKQGQYVLSNLGSDKYEGGN